jgi:hypothetical protein
MTNRWTYYARGGTLLLGISALLVTACGGGDGGGGPSNGAANIEIFSGDGQQAPVNTTVLTPPAVTVTDNSGGLLAGVSVTFTVASGGGSVTGGLATTDGAGVATVGSWKLGTTAGSNTLTAKVKGLPAVTFVATGVADVPSSVTNLTTKNQQAPIGNPVPIAPSVKVVDQFNNGVPGVKVAFDVTAGGGNVSTDTVVTSSIGVATVGVWTLGSSTGLNTLTATVVANGVAGNPVTFNATAISSLYLIDVRFISSVTPSQQQACTDAATRLQSVITGDVPNVAVTLAADACITGQPAVNETIDDLVIFANVTPIDGPGGILGQAGPCLIRTAGSLPALGIMQFDVADLNNLETAGQLDEVILHEMQHVIGYGTIWNSLGIISGAGGADPIFTGANAIAAFNANGGNSYPGTPVPLENTGGAGTRDSHWRETVFKNELMTGFLNAGSNPLSIITVQHFADIGYSVNPGAADAYTVVFPSPPASLQAGIIDRTRDAWSGPLYTVGAMGSLQRVR